MHHQAHVGELVTLISPPVWLWFGDALTAAQYVIAAAHFGITAAPLALTKYGILRLTPLAL